MQQVLLAPALLCVEGVSLVVNTGATLPCHSVIVPSATTHMDSPLLPDDAYLCTGLDLYLTHEPNVLCAMALVHSRIRRVYFMDTQSQYGALASHYHLHSMRALNHKYRVFRVLPELLDANKIKS
jgi:tRNA(Arg) A34 adenosine deaminase TadA